MLRWADENVLKAAMPAQKKSANNYGPYLLRHPREALSQAKGVLPAVHDPRLSEAGNQVWKRVGLLLDVLGRMEVWLAHQGRTGLTPEDRVILSPRFQKLARDAGSCPRPYSTLPRLKCNTGSTGSISGTCR